MKEWQNRPLKKFYTFVFVDCLYVNIRKEMETRSWHKRYSRDLDWRI